MKNLKHMMLALLLMVSVVLQANSAKPKDEVSSLAKRFVEAVDQSNDEALKEMLHADMIQYVMLDGNLIPFKATDFIQMIAEKKIGGIPRKVSLKSAEIVRNQTAYAEVNAVSDEYDFMYHISMANNSTGWVIVGIIADIKAP